MLGLIGVLALVLTSGSSSGLVSLVKDLLPVLVHLQLDNADHGCLEADVQLLYLLIKKILLHENYKKLAL